MEEIIRLSEKYELRNIVAESVLMPKNDALLTEAQPVILDDVSTFIVRQLTSTGLPKDELLSLILQEYDVDKDEAVCGIEYVLNNLKKNGAIK